MQSEIFQAFICYNVDDYDLHITFSQYSNFECGVFIAVSHNHHNYNK